MARSLPPSRTKSAQLKLTVQTLSPAGPTMAYHAGCIINNIFYVHGGIDKKYSKDPLDKFYMMDLAGDRIWKEIKEPNCPALSHHACLVLDNRYVLLIGGWNGKIRTTEVFAFDTEEYRWIFPKAGGFPEGGGLSSHTATLLTNGDIFICGRDGSTRSHRRHGDAYLMKGSLQSGFSYVPFPHSVASRSGHTAHAVGSNLYIIGGRTDKTIEVHSAMKGKCLPCPFVTQVSSTLDKSQPMKKEPCGRKQHVSLAGSSSIFIHGGETFDGKSRDPAGDMFLLTVKPEMKWYKLGDSDVGRAGHVCCPYGDKVIFHGGEGKKAVIHSNSFILIAESSQ